MIAAAVVGLVLAALTPVFQLLPLNVLAAVVVSGVLGVFEWDEALFLFRVSPFDSCWPSGNLEMDAVFLGARLLRRLWLGVQHAGAAAAASPRWLGRGASLKKVYACVI